MMKGILLLLIVLLSCNNIENRQRKEFSDKDEAVDFAISSLRKQDTKNIYNLYYVIETQDSLLYVINTYENNRLPFMYFFDTLDCKSIEDVEYVIYLNRSSFNPQKDNCVGEDFNVMLTINEELNLPELKGMIFKFSIENNMAKYVLIKEGDILKKVESDPNLIIEVIEEEIFERNIK